MRKLALFVFVILLAGIAQPANAVNLGSNHDGKIFTIGIGQTQTYTFSSEDPSARTPIQATLVANPIGACEMSVLQNRNTFKDRWNVTIRGLTKGSCSISVADSFMGAKKPKISFAMNVVAALNPISVAFGLPTQTSRPFLRLMTGGEITVRAPQTSRILATPITTDICTVTDPRGAQYTYGVTFSLKAFALGNCQIRFESPEDSRWAASSLVATIPIQKATQVISYSAIPFWYVAHGPIAAAIKSSSGLPVQVTAGPSSVCSWVNQVLTPIGVGDCLLSMNQAGDATYLQASEVWRFPIRKVDKKITLGAPLRDMVIGSTQVLNITGSKQLSVSTTTPLVCTLNGLVLTAIKAGSCAVTATDVADSGFNAAPVFNGVLAVTLAESKITYRGPSTLPVNSKAVAATFSSNSIAPINVSVADSTVCSYSMTSVIALRPGICVITAIQASTGNFAPAAPLRVSIVISKSANSLVAMPPTRPIRLGSPLAVNLSTNSGVMATLSTSTPSVCSVSGSQVTPLSTGTCRLTIVVPEDTKFSALNSSFALQVIKASQIISASSATSLLSLSNGKTTVLTFSSSSGLPVSVQTSSHCSFANGTLTALRTTTQASLCIVTLTQTGNERFDQAPIVRLSIRIIK